MLRSCNLEHPEAQTPECWEQVHRREQGRQQRGGCSCCNTLTCVCTCATRGTKARQAPQAQRDPVETPYAFCVYFLPLLCRKTHLYQLHNLLGKLFAGFVLLQPRVRVQAKPCVLAHPFQVSKAPATSRHARQEVWSPPEGMVSL